MTSSWKDFLMCWNACNTSVTCVEMLATWAQLAWFFVITERHSALSVFLGLKRPCTLMTKSEKPPILLNSKSWICSWHWTKQFYEQLEVSSWSLEGLRASLLHPSRPAVNQLLLLWLLLISSISVFQWFIPFIRFGHGFCVYIIFFILAQKKRNFGLIFTPRKSAWRARTHILRQGSIHCKFVVWSKTAPHEFFAPQTVPATNNVFLSLSFSIRFQRSPCVDIKSFPEIFNAIHDQLRSSE